MPKSSIAQRLGKKGGKSTATKRTKEQRSEAARKAASKRWEAIKRDREPDTFIFELVLQDHWFSDVTTKRERSYYYSHHRIQPLLDAGYVEFDRTETIKWGGPPDSQHFYYRHTVAGLKWWYEQRIAKYTESSESHISSLGSSNYKFSPSALADTMEGKGMGSPIRLYCGFYDAPAIFTALRDGLFKFVSHTDYCGMPHGPSEYITVELTPSGFEYFSSLPRFVEVWE